MSWWPVPDTPEDITGDSPTDAVDEALTSLQHKPSINELLRSLELAIESRRSRISDVPAKVSLGLRSGETPSPEAPPELTAALERAIEGIAESFATDFARLPRLLEVVYTFTFSLGGEPESVLRAPIPKRIDLTVR
jgi:hypothetical protein